MKTLIVYMSRHGAAEKTAEIIQSSLSGETDLINLRRHRNPDPAPYDTVIIGGSIHAGTIQNRVKMFCKTHHEPLLTKKIGLFLCCMEEGQKAEEQFNTAFPETLRKHATATLIAVGEFNFEQMNFLERIIIKKIAKIESSVSRLDMDKISRFAESMNSV